jgi:methionyl-tRNA formyltransferase
MNNHRPLRIVFMGTPEFAVASMNAIIHSQHKIVAVVTAADKPAGRGLKLQESAVKRAAQISGIPVLQPDKLKAPDFLETLKAFQADVFVVVAFRMLPEMVWSMPPLGSVNVHASLLPNYRGAAPIQRAIMNGEKRSGLTVFRLQQEIDTGDILGKVELDIGDNETAGELHDRMMVAGATLLISVLNEMSQGNCKGIPQKDLSPLETIRSAPKIFRDDGLLDWSFPLDKIHNIVRGLSPYPGAHTHLKGRSLKILRGEKLPFTRLEQDYQVRDGKLLFRCGDGTYSALLVQPEGKKIMTSEEFLRGWRE